MKTNSLSDIGGRKFQEDSCTIVSNNHSTFFLVADGMGGHNGGGIASSIFVNEASIAYQKFDTKIKEPKLFFEEIIENCSQKFKKEEALESSLDLHTTCAMALLQDEKLYCGHIGDSRVYLFDTKSQWHTKDHSVVQVLVDLGEIKEEEMATHPHQNRLLESLSSRSKNNLSFSEKTINLKKSFAILVCSDGFWEYITTKEMQKVLFSNDIKNPCEEMVKMVKKRNGEFGDNISVVVGVEKKKKRWFLWF